MSGTMQVALASSEPSDEAPTYEGAEKKAGGALEAATTRRGHRAAGWRAAGARAAWPSRVEACIVIVVAGMWWMFEGCSWVLRVGGTGPSFFGGPRSDTRAKRETNTRSPHPRTTSPVRRAP